MKLDLLTNATVVDDAIRFVAGKSKDKERVKSLTDNGDKEESKEPDYDEDEDEDQLEEEQGEEAGEITITTNRIF
jgi:hypothetical protein